MTRKIRGIYALRCPLSNLVRYVGSSMDIASRVEAHRKFESRRGNAHNWHVWMRSLLDVNLPMAMTVLEVVPEPDPLAPREHYWIENFRLFGQADLNVCINLTGKKGAL